MAPPGKRLTSSLPDALANQSGVVVVARVVIASPRLSSPKGGHVSTRLTLAMIVRNEGYFLPSFLKRHARHFDEIVVVDTGSTDESVAQLEQIGARVVPFVWKGDFAAARNMGLEHASGDWVMVMDPDEFLAEADLSRLRALVDPDPPVDAYWFYTCNYSNRGGGDGDTGICFDEQRVQPQLGPAFESRKVRLFRRVGDLRFEGAVHEILPVGKLQAKRYRVQASNIKVHHYTNFRPLDHRRNKGFRYLGIGLCKLAETWTVPAQFELTLAYLSVARYDLAATHFEEGIRARAALAAELGRVIGREAAATWQNHVLRSWLEHERFLVAQERLHCFEQGEFARKVRGDDRLDASGTGTQVGFANEEQLIDKHQSPEEHEARE